MLDLVRLALLGDELADALASAFLSPSSLPLSSLDELRRRHRLAAGVVDDLSVDVLEALVDGQPGTLGGAGDLAANAFFALDARSSFDMVFICSVRRRCGCRRAGWRQTLTYAVAGLAFLAANRSSEYLMPLPLYGSGGRSARILAAVCPSSLALIDAHVSRWWAGCPRPARPCRSRGDALGEVEHHRVRIAQREVDFLPLTSAR